MKPYASVAVLATRVAEVHEKQSISLAIVSRSRFNLARTGRLRLKTLSDRKTRKGEARNTGFTFGAHSHTRSNGNLRDGVEFQHDFHVSVIAEISGRVSE